MSKYFSKGVSKKLDLGSKSYNACAREHYQKESMLESARQRFYYKFGNGRHLVSIDSFDADGNGENALDKLGVFSDCHKGANLIRYFDDADADAQLQFALKQFTAIEQQLLKKILKNGKINRERTIKWILKNRLNERYRLRKKWKKDTEPPSAGTC